MDKIDKTELDQVERYLRWLEHEQEEALNHQRPRKAYEAPDGDLVCEACLEDDEVIKWQREEYTQTDPHPGEFCAVCGDTFIEETP